jgi:predicted Zn finger-like uncharacterized protein
MLITCPRCLTKFELAEAGLPATAELRLRCSRCGWEFAQPRPVVDAEPMVAAPVVDAVDEGVAKISDESISSSSIPDDDGGDVFELADDFAEFSSDEPTSESAPAAGGEVDSSLLAVVDEGGTESEPVRDEVEELALDIGDLDLDDIEFDDFGDVDEPPAKSPAAEATETRIDDAGVDELGLDTGDEPAPPAPKKAPAAAPEVNVNLDNLGARSKSPRKSGKRSWVILLACFLVLSLALWAGYGLWSKYSYDMAKLLKLEKVENQTLRLPSGRSLAILRGEVVNDSPNQVYDLVIKGLLLDARGKAGAVATTAGGVSFSLEELDRLDKAKLALLENPQVTVPPGGRLPFMLAFYDYPQSARQGQVEISRFKVKKNPRRLQKSK